MGKVTGFMEIGREKTPRRDPVERLEDFQQVEHLPAEDLMHRQAARCMDCGIPFCHKGCPLGNVIPDWNDLVYRDRWREAIDELHATNNFPEFTGWVCPAPCETACVLGINDDPVTIKHIELAIVERAWQEGWITPLIPPVRTGKRVAIVGSGPAGLAAAQQLNRAGHSVTVFERADRLGGLLMYGIPDFKMEKSVLDRRLQQMTDEGVEFRTNAGIGTDVSVDELKQQYDAIVLACGAAKPRDLPVPGRELDGIHFAMEFLPQQNRRVAGATWIADKEISAKGRRVVIIGGGDTGSDCLGTSLRQGALEVHQFEINPMPPTERTDNQPWPLYPMIFRTSSSHEEGDAAGRLKRHWSVSTTSFEGKDGRVARLHGIQVEATRDEHGRIHYQSVQGTEFDLDTDLVILAMGFTGTDAHEWLAQLGVNLDERGNVRTTAGGYETGVPGIFAAGDMRRGQSLVVWAIAEGREAAAAADQYLTAAPAKAAAGA